MKQLNNFILEKLKISKTSFILEKLKINSKSKINQYKYFPETREELNELINKLIIERGNNADLNDINTSKINDMSNVFLGLEFDGDISKWDVSNVKDMSYMFSECCNFNCDLSNWNVSHVKNMSGMFYKCTKFNGDISSLEVQLLMVIYLNGM